MLLLLLSTTELCMPGLAGWSQQAASKKNLPAVLRHRTENLEARAECTACTTTEYIVRHQLKADEAESLLCCEALGKVTTCSGLVKATMAF